jgi:hypothetical protein
MQLLLQGPVVIGWEKGGRREGEGREKAERREEGREKGEKRP